ncbi:MAG TPA: hypothetical protein VF921_20895 [Vicinamibacterales bacterium]
MLRHTLATLAYRAGKVLRDAPPEFQAFRPSEGGRSAGQILAHMGDLMDWSVSIVERKEAWKDSNAQAWAADVQRFFDGLARFDGCLADPPAADAQRASDRPAAEHVRLFQGPVADALTHVGQLAMLRRMAGAPIRGENYFKADITPGRVGLDQAPPKREH